MDTKEILLLHKIQFYEETITQLNRVLPRDTSNANMERQLCQVLLWLLTYETHATIGKHQDYNANYECARDHLELILHTCKMKKVATVQGVSALTVITNGFTKRKQKKHKQRKQQSEKIDDVFREIMAEHALMEMFHQSDEELKLTASKAIDNAMIIFHRRVWERNKGNRRKTKYRQMESNGTATKENRKARGRADAPWQCGLVTKDANTNEIEETTPLRWKGKLAAKARNNRLREKRAIDFP
jgi:hypothetical protein